MPPGIGYGNVSTTVTRPALITPTSEACQAACAKDKRCAAFQWIGVGDDESPTKHHQCLQHPCLQRQQPITLQPHQPLKTAVVACLVEH